MSLESGVRQYRVGAIVRTPSSYSQNRLIAWRLFPENPMHLYNYATALCVTTCHTL